MKSKVKNPPESISRRSTEHKKHYRTLFPVCDTALYDYDIATRAGFVVVDL